MTVLFLCRNQQENNRYETSMVPAISRTPSSPPPTKNMISIPIPIQNNVYPHTRFIFSTKKAYIISNICSPGFI